MSFSIDNSWLGTIPAGDGFHERGRFDPPNIWATGSIMAPFDEEVIFKMCFMCQHLIKYICIFLVLFYYKFGNWRNKWIFPRRR